jgi:plastocyanin
MSQFRWTLALAVSAALSSAAYADVTGKVTLDGDPPEPQEINMQAVGECAEQHADPVSDPTVVVGEGGALANVIVSVKADDPAALGGEAPTTPVVLDQEGCMYQPHVLSMTAGQEFVVKNSDPFLHNVHSLATVNPAFNFGQPNKDEGKKVDAPRAEEIFRIKCDVHPWMSAYVGVFEHPFHAVSQADGTYKITGSLPDGTHTLVAWHEKFGEQEQQVEVKDGKAEMNFTFKQEGAAAEPTANVILASDVSGEKNCGTGECCKAPARGAVAEKEAPAQPQAAKGAEPQAAVQ